MIDKETLRRIVLAQRKELALFDKGIPRQDIEGLKPVTAFALVLTGIRRCGKSTLLRQLMQKVKGFYYFNFEDPRANTFDISDFEKLEEIFKEEFKEQEYYFFDEIQNIAQWERYIRMLVDIKKQVIITGSNASLLSKELGTRLTGRHLNYELFPFSYKEFLYFRDKKNSLESFDEYLLEGGFPEYLNSKKPNTLQELLMDILARDISIRYKIRNQKALKELAVYLLTNIGKSFTYNSLKNSFKLGSINSVISFISYFEDSYLIFTIPRFDYSLKRMIVNPKKVYAVDNGLSVRNSVSFFDDKGRLLENLVFLNLRRKNKEIFYFQEKNECDFLVREGIKIVQAIQVAYKLNRDNQEREINGLLEAMKKFNLKEGLILTYNQEDKFEIDNFIIKAIPLWKWLIE